MATAKASTFYWPFLAVIGITLITLSPITRKSLFSLALLLIAAVVIAITGLSATRRGYNPKANEYQSLFAGVLALSSKPHQHLAQIGMPEATNCVGVNLYLKERCVKILDKYPEAITFTNVAKVIIREPLIFPRMVKFLADRMQDISIDLGKYSEGSGENRGQVSMLNLWSVMKQRFFPKGIYLLGILSFYLALFSINQKGQRIRREMAVIGLIATLACLLDMWVAFLGEGQADLIKHLLLSNFMFDIATVMALGLITLSIYQRIQNSSRVSGINPL